MPTFGSGSSEKPVASALPAGTSAKRSPRSLFSTSDRTSSAGKSGLSRPGMRMASTVPPLALSVGMVIGSTAASGLGLIAGWAPRVLRGMGPEHGPYLRERRLRIEIADHHQDRVIRRVPFAVERLQLRGGGLVERRPRAERIMLIGGAREHDLAQASGTSNNWGWRGPAPLPARWRRAPGPNPSDRH